MRRKIAKVLSDVSEVHRKEKDNSNALDDIQRSLFLVIKVLFAVLLAGIAGVSLYLTVEYTRGGYSYSLVERAIKESSAYYRQNDEFYKPNPGFFYTTQLIFNCSEIGSISCKKFIERSVSKLDKDYEKYLKEKEKLEQNKSVVDFKREYNLR